MSYGWLLQKGEYNYHQTEIDESYWRWQPALIYVYCEAGGGPLSLNDTDIPTPLFRVYLPAMIVVNFLFIDSNPDLLAYDVKGDAQYYEYLERGITFQHTQQ